MDPSKLPRSSTHKKLAKIILKKPYNEAKDVLHDLKSSGKGKINKEDSVKNEELKLLISSIESLVEEKKNKPVTSPLKRIIKKMSKTLLKN